MAVQTETLVESETPKPLIFNKGLREKIKKAKVLVVGAGGIGCELLKNLVLTGFGDIEIIDMDTIDVSNLNRQFLFHKKHVGMSKANVAKESVLQLNPNAKIISHHASVTSSDFGVSYIKQFTLVLNALDNLQARNHVNRVCLAAKVPLIESGTAGYSGQVELIFKGLSKCYECDGKPKRKTFPGCTIRNTPSELIHCIVWAKHAFNQLFGECDPTNEDEDVSPDLNDEEAGVDKSKVEPSARITTRMWAEQVKYDPEKLFQKFFHDDIKTLLVMSKLWEKRQPPEPLTLEAAVKKTDVEMSEGNSTPRINDQKQWSLAECCGVFIESVDRLKKEFEREQHGFLIWDKDDKAAMDFVASVANIRAYIFHIKQNSRFEIKSMAGNIIPAIATSNASTAGLIVLMAANIIRGELNQCQSVYLRKSPNTRGFVMCRENTIFPPKPRCAVCSPKPVLTIATDLSKMKIKEFGSLVLKERLNMIEPEVILERTGNIILSSEEGEADDLQERTMQDLGAVDGSVLDCDDFLQNYRLQVIVKQRDMKRDEPPFLVLEEEGNLKPSEEKEEKKANGTNDNKPSSSKDEDDDVLLVSEPLDEEPRKRKLDECPVPVKKRKTEQQDDDDDDTIVL